MKGEAACRKYSRILASKESRLFTHTHTNTHTPTQPCSRRDQETLCEKVDSHFNSHFKSHPLFWLVLRLETPEGGFSTPGWLIVGGTWH
jgi:hypothetical protein